MIIGINIFQPEKKKYYYIWLNVLDKKIRIIYYVPDDWEEKN